MRPSRRRLTEQGADLAARVERLVAERDAALEEASAHKVAAETSSRLFVEVDEKYVDVCIVKERLTEDLAANRRELADVRKVEESRTKVPLPSSNEYAAASPGITTFARVTAAPM